MKKTVNLVALIVMVSTNIITPFSYADVENVAIVDIEQPVVEQPKAPEILEPENPATPEVQEPELPEVSEPEAPAEQPKSEPETGTGVDGKVETPAIETPETGTGVDGKVETPAIETPETGTGMDEKVETPSIETPETGTGAEEKVETPVVETPETGTGAEEKVETLVDNQLTVDLSGGNNLSGNDIIDLMSGLDLNKENLEKMDVNMYTVTFDTNGGSSKDSLTVTGGTKLTKMITKYSHTPNIDDNGTGNAVYPNSANLTGVITITGAESLHVTLTYQTEDPYWDWVCIWGGNYPNYTASSNYSTAIGGKLGGSTKTTEEYDIQGDSVTFGFVSDSTVNEYYGYYAIIEGETDILGDVPIRKGSIFSGWYTSGGVLWDVKHDVVESDITLYAHWDCDFGYEESDDGNSCVEIEYSTEIEGNDDTRNNFKYKIMNVGKYTIMDRNLGAKEPWDGVSTWVENNSMNLDSYGYYYQWGNNFGFKQNTQDIGRLYDIEIPLDKIPSKYSSGNYFYLSTWPEYTDDLRGDVTNVQSARRGPCPEGWHVPSKDEWIGIYNEWLSDPNRTITTDSEVGANFAKDLLLPPQGHKSTRIGASQDLWSVNWLGEYYSSTPVNEYYFSSSNTGHSAYDLTVKKGEVRYNQGASRYYLEALRCMKDFPSVVITYHPDGGKLTTIYQEVKEGEEIGETPIPTKENNRFLGWYLDEDLTESFDISMELTGDIDLYAKWGCQIGTVEGDDGSCMRIDNNEYTAQLSGSNEQNNNFTYKTIQIGEYIIMDRDLGALTSNGKGYWYQWGNNYGFGTPTPQSSNSVSIPADNIPSKYSSGVWHTNSPWTTEKNLWGNTSGTDIARRGPCPEGWHVPSTADWNGIYSAWSSSSEKNTVYLTDGYNFVVDTNLNSFGFMTEEGGNGFSTSTYGGISYASLADYRTSTPTDEVGKMYNFNVSVAYGKSNNSEPSSRGYPVRCFKNAPLYTLRFHTNGGEMSEPEEQQIQKNTFKTLPTPTTGNSLYTFSGWYYNENFTGARASDRIIIARDLDLYARWTRLYTVVLHIRDNETQQNVVDEGSNLLALAPTTFPDGYIVGGWFLDSGYTQKYDIIQPVTGDLELYAKGFEFGTITIEDPGNPLSGFMIMDRNLGAFEAGTGVNSYGYHYQWGNNYGFPNTGRVADISTRLTWDPGYDNKGFYKTGYRTSNGFWSDYIYHTGVWGGALDYTGNNRGLDIMSTTSGNRQGPCPEGWHVPSAGEWSKLMEYWKKRYDGGASLSISRTNYLNEYSFYPSTGRNQFINDLKLPAAGYRNQSSSSSNQGNTWSYRSSSPYKGYDGYAYNLYFRNDVEYIRSHSNYTIDWGKSVRCFKNEYNPTLHTIKFETNGGESIPDMAVVEGKTLIKGDPIYVGHFFKGWYKDEDLTQPYDMTVPVNEDMTLYAKWDNSFGTISISDPYNINSGFTIMDRNLGALEVGTGKDSYGYLYQWGNNHGFSNNPKYVVTTTMLPAWNGTYDDKGYYGTQFVAVYNGQSDYWRDNLLHDRLRGGSGDNQGNNRGLDVMGTTSGSRQGPCPEGYHIPSAGEWSKLIEYRAKTYTGENNSNLLIDNGYYLLNKLTSKLPEFQGYFELPFAGRYEPSNGNASYSKGDGGNPSGFYRTSSPNSPYDRKYAIGLFITKDNMYSYNSYSRSNGFSIRCFANDYVPSIYVLSFETNGGEEIENREIRKNHKLTGLPKAEREHSKFEGWYLDDKFTQEYDFNELIDKDLKIYAKWSCDAGYQLSDDYQFCEKISVKFYANGGKFGDSDKTINVVNTITNKISSDDVKISHTPNVSDDGTQNGNYAMGLSTNEVITIPGAEKLNIKIRYGSYYNDGNYSISDWLSVWTGSHPGYTAYNNYSTSFVGKNGRLWGGNHNDSIVEYEVDGDTLTFGFRSYGSYAYGSERYGYYAVVTEPGRYETHYEDDAFDNILEPKREGYTFSGWYLDNGTFEHEFNPLEVTTGASINVYARWNPNTYTIKFDINGGIGEVSDIDATYGEEIILPNVTRDGYTFSGWKDENGKIYTGKIGENESFTTENGVVIILTAQWEENKSSDSSSSSPNSSSGGGKRIAPASTDPISDKIKEKEHNSADEKQDADKSADTQENQDSSIPSMDGDSQSEVNTSEGQNGGENRSSQEVPQYTNEQKEAYSFAKSNGITTTPSIEKAKMNTSLKRIEMAKMLSNYAINILGQEPDASKGTVKFNDVTINLDRKYDDGVTKAYQLGIMGINMKNNEFRPDDEVTRAEFVTALSRLLYSTPEGTNKGTKKYYEPHMAKLYNEGIITKTDPNMKEKRGNVMIMLMRAVK